MHSSSRSTPLSTIWLLEVPYGYMKLGVVSVTPRAEISSKEKQKNKTRVLLNSPSLAAIRRAQTGPATHGAFLGKLASSWPSLAHRPHPKTYLETREELKVISKGKRLGVERMLGRQRGERRKRGWAGGAGMVHQESLVPVGQHPSCPPLPPAQRRGLESDERWKCRWTEHSVEDSHGKQAQKGCIGQLSRFATEMSPPRRIPAVPGALAAPPVSHWYWELLGGRTEQSGNGAGGGQKTRRTNLRTGQESFNRRQPGEETRQHPTDTHSGGLFVRERKIYQRNKFH